MIFRSTRYDFTFNVGVASRTWDVYISKDGSEYELAEGTVAAISNDGYVFSATIADMDANIISILIIENNEPLNTPDFPIKYEATVVTEDPLTFNGAAYLNNLEYILTAIYNHMGGEVWTYTMYTDHTLSTPLNDCTIRMSLDAEGEIIIGEKLTGIDGKTRWLVNRGYTYYMWRSKPGYGFSNPDVEVIDSVGTLTTTLSESAAELLPLKEGVGKPSSIAGEPISIKSTIVDWRYIVYSDSTMTKRLPDCLVHLCRDAEGYDVVEDKYTDENGETFWKLEPGEYYVWREKPKYRFVNPDKQKVG